MSVFKAENPQFGQAGVKNVSFEVRKGEILGFAGLVGAGRTGDHGDNLFGMRKKDSGRIPAERERAQHQVAP